MRRSLILGDAPQAKSFYNWLPQEGIDEVRCPLLYKEHILLLIPEFQKFDTSWDQGK